MSFLSAIYSSDTEKEFLNLSIFSVLDFKYNFKPSSIIDKLIESFPELVSTKLIALSIAWDPEVLRPIADISLVIEYIPFFF